MISTGSSYYKYMMKKKLFSNLHFFTLRYCGEGAKREKKNENKITFQSLFKIKFKKIPIEKHT